MFHSARLKLTAWYLLIIMVICIMFSIVIYHFLIGEVTRFDRLQQLRFEKQILQYYPMGRVQVVVPLESADLVAEIHNRIVSALFAVNGGILVISGIVGYILAGRTLKPIQDMVTEQHRFISDASHELKTPLTSLKTAFEVYLREKKPTLTGAKELIGESIAEVNKLQSLSDSLLTLAHMDAPQEALPFVRVSVHAVITQAIKRTQVMAHHKKIEVEMTGNDYTVMGIEESLVDVCVILLDNAIKYSDKGKKVTVDVSRKGTSVRIDVIDQGIGIRKKDVPHIFDRFYRADTARTHSEKNGYGLGLSIAKKIIEQHHGSLRVESIVNKGSTFRITLPLA